MFTSRDLSRLRFLLLILLVLVSAADGQRKNKKHQAAVPEGRPVLWERVDIPSRNLFFGPGGEQMQPNISSVTFIQEEKGGHNKKYRIKDANGMIWVAKLGTEAQPETAAVRLLWGLGYKTEINYLVPTITIPGKGTFRNVRLEARPDNVKRLNEWQWKNNPFVGTNQLQGLKIMQVFMNNYDLLDLQNKVLQVNGRDGTELQYIISDLGSTFGKFGNNNLPIFFRFGRRANSPTAWSRAKFIKGAKNGYIRLATTGSKNRGLMKNITVDQARWLADLLLQLDERQLRDVFRAANYSPAEVDILTKAAQRRIAELDRVSSGVRVASR